MLKIIIVDDHAIVRAGIRQLLQEATVARGNYEGRARRSNPLNDKNLPLKGLSKSTYNAVLFYSKDNWNARLAYNYRDEYFQTVQLGLPRFVDSIARLTAKVKYKFDNGLSVYIQGNNLTNETSYEYLGDKFRPRVTSANGRQFAVGFNFKF